jgi:hypothetical protein
MTIERMEQMSNDMPGWLATLKQEDPDMFCEILQAQIAPDNHPRLGRTVRG